MIDDIQPELRPLMEPLGIMTYYSGLTDNRLRNLLFIATCPDNRIEAVKTLTVDPDPTLEDFPNGEHVEKFEAAERFFNEHMCDCEDKGQFWDADALINLVASAGLISDPELEQRLGEWIKAHRALKPARNRLSHDAIDVGIYLETDEDGHEHFKVRPLRLGLAIQPYKKWARKRVGPPPDVREHVESLSKEGIEETAAAYRNLNTEAKNLIYEIAGPRGLEPGIFVY
ncbi:hypothetical protein [Roseibium sp.]|uniref:hypothetical protein n=1 Tax=Roseibium sp. TaxID=1936156 RepID=UPI003D0C7C3A